MGGIEFDIVRSTTFCRCFDYIEVVGEGVSKGDPTFFPLEHLQCRILTRFLELKKHSTRECLRGRTESFKKRNTSYIRNHSLR